MLSQQMCFLQIKADSLMTHVRAVGVGWRGQEAFGRLVGPFPGCSTLAYWPGLGANWCSCLQHLLKRTENMDWFTE